MRLATIRRGGEEVAAVVVPGGAVPVGGISDPDGDGWSADLLSLLESRRLDELRSHVDGLREAGAEEFSARAIPLPEVEYGPLYRRPRKIWGIGLNYVEHAGDLEETAPSEEPASFMRPDTAIIGPGEEIRLPHQSERVTGEAELGLIIGREAKNVSEEEAPSVVAGLTTILDMTAEDILRKNPRYLTRAKSFDTFFGFGPQLVTPDEVGEIGTLTVATVLNGETRRENVVSNMTFSPWFLVSFHSKVMTLLPGDIISTGTPGAVEIQDGDVVSCRIDGFEALSNPVVRRS
ncbi:MAG: fumarylacetoacetate hydrolase family protein [Actinobacteria bacterium]|nr:fumarylacetoacetate hydrolase family protein [Actinomycetota bacterium]